MPPARSSFLRHTLRVAGLFGAGIALGGGCYVNNEGFPPPTRGFYFPTGLAVSPGRTALYVANSDFDLQYNGGTVQVIDLTWLRPKLATLLDGPCPQPVPPVEPPVVRCMPTERVGGLRHGFAAKDACAAVEVQVLKERPRALLPNGNQILSPGPCEGIDPVNAMMKFAGIGAFASGLVIATNPDTDPAHPEAPSAMLFAPVRGDPSITWFDITDDRGFDLGDPDLKPSFRLECGQTGEIEKRCDDQHRMGLDPYDNPRDLLLPVEPVGFAVSEDGRAMVAAHQTQAAVSLATNSWNLDPTVQRYLRPSFQFVLGSLANGPTEVARVPIPRVVSYTQQPQVQHAVPPMIYQRGFLVTYNQTPELDLFRVNDDALSVPPKPFITRAVQAGISVNADGKDSRGIVVDPTDRQACESACDVGGRGNTSTVAACLRECAAIPLGVFIANRSPPSLLVGRIRTQIVDSDLGGAIGSGAFDTVEIVSTVSLALGPSKVALGMVIGPDGRLHRRIFAVTFDSRLIFSYDPEADRVDAVIRTGRGPHAIAFDTGDDGDGTGLHSYLYVGHFTDSYLGVVDLDMTHPETFGTMFASIGTPTAPRESK
jgi:hypothetical protein